MDWNVIVNAIVGGIVCWYTIETKKIRQQGGTQLELMQKQSEQGQQQIKLVERQLELFAAEVDTGKRQLELARQQARLTQKPFLELTGIGIKRQGTVEWIAYAQAGPDRICHHVTGIVIDKSQTRVDVSIAPGQVELLHQKHEFFFNGCVTIDDGRHRLASLYGELGHNALNTFSIRD